MFTVLFTAVGRRVQLIQAFRESFLGHGMAVRLIGVDLNPDLAPAGYFTDRIYQVPKYNEAAYLHRLAELCRQEQVDLLIPLFEPEFPLLDQQRDLFDQIGTVLLLSDQRVIQTCQDKYQTALFLQQLNVKTPLTWTVDALPCELEFPLLAKPRRGMGSAGIMKIASREQLARVKQETEYLIQQFITGTEYTLDILADFSGRVLSVVPRQRLEVRSGEVSKSRTVKRPDLVEQGLAITQGLGAAGPINLQCIVNETGIYWIEINPRLGGGVPLSIQAGVDYPYLLYRLWQGEAVEPLLGQFQADLIMLRFDAAVFTQG